ncbi:MAG: enolase [Candidatus Paceibacterota bacterium]
MTKTIEKIYAEEILDSRGNPTLLVNVFSSGKHASFAVPSGASTGINEAHELRDKDGKGVRDAIHKVNNIIAPMLVGFDIFNQSKIDLKMISMDGTKNKKVLGGNSILGVSIAVAKVAALVKGVPLHEYLKTLSDISPSHRVPYLYMNLINGGKHADNELAFQEYHIVPFVDDASLSIEIGIKIDSILRDIIQKELGDESVLLGDEGGFAPKLKSIRTPLEYLKQAISLSPYQDKVGIALDVAASSFYEDGFYMIDGEKKNAEELQGLYSELIKEFNIFSIEDPFNEDDFENFNKLKNAHPDLVVIGDDLTVTNKILLHQAIKQDAVNGIIIKPNQIGTLSETLETMKLASFHKVKIIISHRSGETNDDFIADLAFAFGTFGLKSGAPTKTERMVKYNRLINISKK